MRDHEDIAGSHVGRDAGDEPVGIEFRRQRQSFFKVGGRSGRGKWRWFRHGKIPWSENIAPAFLVERDLFGQREIFDQRPRSSARLYRRDPWRRPAS
jgi:hypothetical protein